MEVHSAAHLYWELQLSLQHLHLNDGWDTPCCFNNSSSRFSSIHPLFLLFRGFCYQNFILSRGNILAAQVYGYRKGESLKGKAMRDPQLYNKFLSKHNKPQPDLSHCDRMQDHKDDGDRTGQALYRNKHLPCKQIG